MNRGGKEPLSYIAFASNLMFVNSSTFNVMPVMIGFMAPVLNYQKPWGSRLKNGTVQLVLKKTDTR